MSLDPERVLIHAPYGRDATVIADVLRHASITGEVCLTIDDLCHELRAESGAVMIADEALPPKRVEQMSLVLRDQEEWSDLPVLVLTGSGEATASTRFRATLLAPLGNVSLLERPLRKETAVSSVETALRVRRHQYRVRELIRAERAAIEALRASQEDLRLANLALTDINR